MGKERKDKKNLAEDKKKIRLQKIWKVWAEGKDAQKNDTVMKTYRK